MLATETFELTYDVFNDMLTDWEYEVRLNEHNKLNLPGTPSKKRYAQIVNVGGTRSSKTYSVLQILKLEMQKRRDLDIKVWRKTKVECRAICRKDFKKIIRDDKKKGHLFKEHVQDGTITYKPTNSMITFTGADAEGVVMGAGQTISFFNEVNYISEKVYNQVCQRTEETVFCDYNPAAGFYLEPYRNNPLTKFIHTTFLNNYYCPPAAAVKTLSYEPWERGSYDIVGHEIWYDGKPISPANKPPVHKLNLANQTIDEYMWMVYGLGLGAEKPNKIYRGWGKISLEDFNALDYTSYFGLDFGTSSPSACVEVKYDGNGSFFIRERLYEAMGKIDESMITVLKQRIPEMLNNYALVVCDSAKKDYVTRLKRADFFAMGAKKGNGSVEPGIELVQNFKINIVPYGNPDSTEDNLNNEYNGYSWEVNRMNEQTDKPVKKDDHLMDAVRYILTYLVTYLDIKLG